MEEIRPVREASAENSRFLGCWKGQGKRVGQECGKVQQGVSDYSTAGVTGVATKWGGIR